MFKRNVSRAKTNRTIPFRPANTGIGFSRAPTAKVVESGSEKEGGGQKKTLGGKRLFLIILLLGFLIAALGAGYYVFTKYTIKNIYVDGNVHYTQEEIQNFVMEGPLGKNSLYLSLKYKKKGVENIPFVDVMDVSILSPDTIKITVYEKALAGYIKYLDTYMYFDKDGYVVECADVLTLGVPQIAGLDFNYVVMGERIPVEDESIFNDIMNITKLLNKYDLAADKIYFHSSGDITIYFGDVKAALGNDNQNLEDKLMRIPQFLSKISGKKGTLRMENCSEDNPDVTFEPDAQ